MLEEKDVSSESNPVTDADLDAALQNMDVEVIEKAKKEKAKEVGEKPIEQLDGSMLGRKVKQVMDENKQLKDSLAQILERLDGLSYRPPKDRKSVV
jgi:small-conductance mechanosensitive channel